MVEIILTGDVNLMSVDGAQVPFRQVREMLHGADLVFSNLECCLSDRFNEGAHGVEGFFADPVVAGRALNMAGIAAVGVANNVNYGSQAILESIARLDELRIAHTGAGANDGAARAPAIVERGGLRIAFVQRSSVFWATDHEATEHSPGIAVIRGHTAYQVPMYKEKSKARRPPLNRPGIPPHVVTWADRLDLRRLEADLAAARSKADLVIASFHWGWNKEIFEYMREIAHCAIDAGADTVVGHGAHHTAGVEFYRGKPVFYGLGSFSFHTGHGGVAHDDWIGMAARLKFDGRQLARSSFFLVRHNEANETFVCDVDDEARELEDITARSRVFGTALNRERNEVFVSAPG